MVYYLCYQNRCQDCFVPTQYMHNLFTSDRAAADLVVLQNMLDSHRATFQCILGSMQMEMIPRHARFLFL